MMSHVIYMIREAPTDPLGLSHLCKSSLGVLVLAYVISLPWVLPSRALKLCACSVGPGRQGGMATIGGSCQKFLNHGLINEVTWCFHAQGIPPLIHSTEGCPNCANLV